MRSQNKIRLPRFHCDVSHGGSREVGALVLRPVLTTVHRNPESEFSAQEKKIGIDSIFFDHMGVPLHADVLHREGSPSLAVVGGFVDIWLDVAEGVAIKGCVSGCFIEAARL